VVVQVVATQDRAASFGPADPSRLDGVGPAAVFGEEGSSDYVLVGCHCSLLLCVIDGDFPRRQGRQTFGEDRPDG